MGLVADLGHVARASSVQIDIRSSAFEIPEALSQVASALAVDPLTWVLRGGDDHALVATFPTAATLPIGWHEIGSVLEADTGGFVTVDGTAYAAGGFDHFA